jgi:hypothetical protein
VERAPKENPVNRPHKKTPIGAHRSEGQQSHTDEPATGFARAQAALGGNDFTKVAARTLVTCIQEPLETGDVLGGLVHPSTPPE